MQHCSDGVECFNSISPDVDVCLGAPASCNRDSRILIIDDKPEEIRSIVAHLQHHQLRPIVANDGWQGYQLALATIPSLILLDVRMPNMDGFAVCRLLRESPTTRRIPIIFLSCADTPEERLKGLTQGGMDYVIKPGQPNEILARIRIHLQLEPKQGSSLDQESDLTLEQALVHAAIRYIREHLDDLPSLDNIARQVGIYDKKLSNLFRKHIGTTVFSWIREERLRVAQKLLLETKLNIHDISQQVGFRSPCNLITAFRERKGVTPAQFRKAKTK